MKNINEIRVNAAQLKLIIGENINYHFPTKKVLTKVGKEVLRKLPATIGTILKTSDYALKRSHDERFDGKHPITLAVDSIRKNGLNKTIIANIRGNYNCQNKKDIVGGWKVLNDIITDEHKAHILQLLSDTREANILKFGSKYYR